MNGKSERFEKRKRGGPQDGKRCVAVVVGFEETNTKNSKMDWIGTIKPEII